MTDTERLERLEDAFLALVLYVTENAPRRALRSITAPAQGARLVEVYEAIVAERDAANG